MAWNNVLLSKKFILYKEGISNKSVEEFFIRNKVDYFVKCDDDELNYLDKDFIVIKSPGIPSDTLFLKQCRRLNVKVINDIELFYLLRSDIKYIGITGSCGKTTTCNLLYNIMKEKYNVFVCGNIGIPIFKFIDVKQVAFSGFVLFTFLMSIFLTISAFILGKWILPKIANLIEQENQNMVNRMVLRESDKRE